VCTMRACCLLIPVLWLLFLSQYLHLALTLHCLSRRIFLALTADTCVIEALLNEAADTLGLRSPVEPCPQQNHAAEQETDVKEGLIQIPAASVACLDLKHHNHQMLPTVLQQTGGDDCNIKRSEVAEILHLEEPDKMQGCYMAQELRMQYAREIHNEIMGMGMHQDAVYNLHDIYTPTDMQGKNMQTSNDMSAVPPSPIALPPAPLHLHPRPQEEAIRVQHDSTQQLPQWQDRPVQVSLYIYFTRIGVIVLHFPNS
jgi:hypothetical protein